MLEGDVSNRKFEGVHDRFLKDSTYLDLQLKIGWTEETCTAMDNIAHESHSDCPLLEEFDRYRKNLFLTLNKSGRNAPMKLRSDFREALTNMHRLHRNSGEERPEPIPLYQYQGGIRRLLHPVPHGVSGTNTGGAHKIKTVSEQHQRTGRPVLNACSSRYSEDFFNLL